MALADLAAFRLACSEFEQVSDEKIQEYLDQAAESVPEDPWFGRQKEGHIQLAAHLLASSPMGHGARFESKDGPSTTYKVRYDELCEIVACGTRVF